MLSKSEQLQKNTTKTEKPKRLKKCHYCLERSIPYGDMRTFCIENNSCIESHNVKTKKKEKAKAVKEFNATDKKWLKKQARYWCHKYIRLRDQHLPCVSCNLYYTELNTIQAGHLKNDGNHAMIRYHEDNINGQCVRCNMHKSGEEKLYEAGLRNRIGNERVDYILSIAFEVKDYSIEELKNIIETYKTKIKALD